MCTHMKFIIQFKMQLLKSLLCFGGVRKRERERGRGRERQRRRGRERKR